MSEMPDYHISENAAAGIGICVLIVLIAIAVMIFILCGMKTKKYPKGQPNVLLARSIESGSSIAKKRPFVAPAVRKTKKAAEETMAKIIDEESAKTLHFNNRRRVLRAIEIYETTGKRKSEMLEEQEHICLYDAYFVGLTLPRDVLYERINKRVDVMMENGLKEEMERLYSQGLTRNHQSMKAIG